QERHLLAHEREALLRLERPLAEIEVAGLLGERHRERDRLRELRQRRLLLGRHVLEPERGQFDQLHAELALHERLDARRGDPPAGSSPKPRCTRAMRSRPSSVTATAANSGNTSSLSSPAMGLSRRWSITASAISSGSVDSTS